MIFAEFPAPRWSAGTLLRDLGDPSEFSRVMVVRHLTSEWVLTVRVKPTPWASRSERGVCRVLASNLRVCRRPGAADR